MLPQSEVKHDNFLSDELSPTIHIQYCDIMRFMVLHNRHHKVSQSVSFFMCHKTVTVLLTIRVRGHFVMSVKKNHESHYVTVLDNSLHTIAKLCPDNTCYHAVKRD